MFVNPEVKPSWSAIKGNLHAAASASMFAEEYFWPRIAEWSPN